MPSCVRFFGNGNTADCWIGRSQPSLKSFFFKSGSSSYDLLVLGIRTIRCPVCSRFDSQIQVKKWGRSLGEEHFFFSLQHSKSGQNEMDIQGILAWIYNADNQRSVLFCSKVRYVSSWVDGGPDFVLYRRFTSYGVSRPPRLRMNASPIHD